MRCSYVFPLRWMVIYEYEVPGGFLNLSSTKLPRSWSPRESFPSIKNPHGRTGNLTRDFMISSQELWPLDHEVGHSYGIIRVVRRNVHVTCLYQTSAVQCCVNQNFGNRTNRPVWNIAIYRQAPCRFPLLDLWSIIGMQAEELLTKH
jgi:hypothetical protein